MSDDFFGWRAFFGPAERGDTAVLRFVTAPRAFPFLGGRRAFCGVCLGAGFHGVQPVASTFSGLFGFARLICARSLTRFMLPCCKSLPLQSQRRFCCGCALRSVRAVPTRVLGCTASEARLGVDVLERHHGLARHRTATRISRPPSMAKQKPPKQKREAETQTGEAETRVVQYNKRGAGCGNNPFRAGRALTPP